MIAAIRVVIIREVFCGGFLWKCNKKSTRDDDVEQSLERGRLDVVDGGARPKELRGEAPAERRRPRFLPESFPAVKTRSRRRTPESREGASGHGRPVAGVVVVVARRVRRVVLLGRVSDERRTPRRSVELFLIAGNFLFGVHPLSLIHI